MKYIKISIFILLIIGTFAINIPKAHAVLVCAPERPVDIYTCDPLSITNPDCTERTWDHYSQHELCEYDTFNGTCETQNSLCSSETTCSYSFLLQKCTCGVHHP